MQHRTKRAYELVSYNQKTGVAKAREVTDQSLLRRIAIELHLFPLEAREE